MIARLARLALAAIIAASLAGCVSQPRVIEVSDTACEWVVPKLTALYQETSSTGSAKFNYTKSFLDSVDEYTTIWNYKSEVSAGRSQRKAWDYVNAKIGGAGFQEMDWAQSLGLAFQIGVESGLRAPSDSWLTWLQAEINSHSKLKVILKRDLKVLTLDALMTTGEVPDFLGTRFQKGELSQKAQSSIFENAENYLIARALNDTRSESTFGPDFDRKVLNQILSLPPTGIATSLIYYIYNLNPVLAEDSKQTVKSYVNSLRISGGGFSIEPGGSYDPQVSYYSSVVTQSLTSLVRSENFAQMKYGDTWLAKMGNMQIGTEILANVLLKNCRNQPITNPNSQAKNLYECVRNGLTTADESTFKNWLSQSRSSKVREVALERLCDFQTAKVKDQPAVASGVSKLSIKDLLADKIIKNSPRISTRDEQGFSLLASSGCRYMNSSLTPKSDLFSTAICAANGAFSKALLEEARAHFLPKSGSESQSEAYSSVEAAIWYAVLLSAPSNLGELLILN